MTDQLWLVDRGAQDWYVYHPVRGGMDGLTEREATEVALALNNLLPGRSWTDELGQSLALIEVLQEAGNYSPDRYEIPPHSEGADLVRRLAMALREWVKLAEDEKRARDYLEKRRHKKGAVGAPQTTQGEKT